PKAMRPNFRIGNSSSGAVTIDELGVYNYAFNATDVGASYNATQSAAIAASGAHGMEASALWAPGDGNVLVMADAGNDHEATADRCDVTIRNGATTVATDTIFELNGGFGQKLIHVSTPFAPGTYTARIAFKSASGATLDSQTTTAFVVPSTM